MTTTINASTSSGLVNTADTSGILQLQTASTAAVTIDASQNVGIGTASPPSKLSVKQSANSTTGGLQLIRSDNSNYTAIYMGGDDLYYQNTANGGQIFYTNNTERMRIDSSGNVGIGTASPSAFGAGYTSLCVNGSTAPIVDLFVGGTRTASFNGTSSYAQVGTVANVPFLLSTNGTERMRITSTGAVGINTSSPSTNFQAVGTTLLSSASTYGASSAAISVYNGASSANYYKADNHYWQQSGGTTTMQVDSAGNLYVVGIYNNPTSGGGNVRVQSNGLLQRDTSSLKYKNSIENATHGLNEVLALRPVTYKSNTDGDKVFGGLIAEEVDAAGLIEFVQYAEDGSPDALSYGNMVSLAFKAIQEQQALITDLTTRLAALEGAK
jgi:hypothetical protein